ncbi:ribosomal RNA small subunit methyltransferase A [bacterium F16]|nr:ribosomal RNA small subunit methyltransferase A [bacterium F16]
MKLQELKALLTELGIRPSRKLGQNFLIDPNTIQRICRCADIKDGDLIIEIGPGTGAMTDYLLQQDIDLIAVEYDVRLADYLRNTYGSYPNFTLIQADASRIDFDEVTNGREWKCSANLPYSVSTVIMAKIAMQENLPKSMTLLLQNEMVDRISAPSGSKTYGSLSVRLQTLFEARKAGTVGPTVFWPPPDVDSAILTLQRKDDRLTPVEFKGFDKLVKHCFAQRRKKLKKRLASFITPEKAQQAFASSGLSPDARPEQLSPNDFIALFRAISS